MDFKEHLIGPEVKDIQTKELMGRFRAEIDQLKTKLENETRLKYIKSEKLTSTDRKMYERLKNDQIKSPDEISEYRHHIPQNEKDRHEFAAYLGNMFARIDLPRQVAKAKARIEKERLEKKNRS